MIVAFGELGELVVFPTVARAWLAGQGIVHFVVGRCCNYKSSQLMGVNLAAPVVQPQVPFAMMLAVVTLHEKFTVLQVFGSVLMLGGSFITQSNAGKGRRRRGHVVDQDVDPAIGREGCLDQTCGFIRVAAEWDYMAHGLYNSRTPAPRPGTADQERSPR